MLSFAVSFPVAWTRMHAIREKLALFPCVPHRSEHDPEDARHRRAFIQEMMNRNPDAFQSDLDVQSMMQSYPDWV
ncbi:hypothetical protein QEZ52_18740 [Aliisedimentitalea scapharcae]|uniref:Transposase n=1 Tax=Aliisedimentitalea scapharcae TaxID=1524259 RepID=A0ABZ2XR97_9RHOB